MAFICLQCTTAEEEVAFLQLKDLKVHEMTGHTTRPVIELPVDPRPPTPSATELKEAEQKVEPVVVVAPPVQIEWKSPILKYQWQGKCRNCNTDFRTIEVVGDGYNTCVAYCVACNEEFFQERVIPIGEQMKVPPSVRVESFETMMKGKKK